MSIKKFLSHTSGGVALTFALSLLPIVGAIGGAVDYSNLLQAKTKIQSAADSAVLSVVSQQYTSGKVLTNDQITAAVTAQVNANLAVDKIAANPQITVTNANSIVTADLNVAVPNGFMKIFGLKNSTVHAHAAATMAGGSISMPNEVALVLDITYSMTQNGKSAGLISAANNMVNTLLGSGSTNTKISMVPYASYVNIGTQYQGQPWLQMGKIGFIGGSGITCTSVDLGYQLCSSGSVCTGTFSDVKVPDVWGTCTKDGVTTSCITQAGYTYGSCSVYTLVNSCYEASQTNCTGITISDQNYVWGGLVGSRGNPGDLTDAIDASTPVSAITWDTLVTWSNLAYPNVPPLQRLTSDKTLLTNQINGLTFDGETYIPTGLLWGWRTLSPKGTAPFGDGAAYKSATKYLVLMTDGFNTLNAPADALVASAANLAQARQRALAATGFTQQMYDSNPAIKILVDGSANLLFNGSGVNTSDIHHDGTNAEAADLQMLSTCSAIKATGIVIFTVTFEVANTASNANLQSCATDSAHYFNAQNNADLLSAFKSISASVGGSVGKPRLVQ